MRLKSNNYMKVISLVKEIQASEDWKLIDNIPLYGGGGEKDIDYYAEYYNEKANKAIQVIINHNSKSASIKKIPVKDLDFPQNNHKTR